MSYFLPQIEHWEWRNLSLLELISLESDLSKVKRGSDAELEHIAKALQPYLPKLFKRLTVEQFSIMLKLETEKAIISNFVRKLTKARIETEFL